MALSSFFERIGAVQARSHPEDPRFPVTSAGLVDLYGGGPTDSGESVTVRSALGLTSVYRAVNIVAGTCALVPLHAYERSDGADNKIDVTDKHPVLWDPHPEMTDYELFSWIYTSCELSGNAFLQKIRHSAASGSGDGRRVRYLFPVRGDMVRVGRASDGTKWFEITDLETGQRHPASTADILHIPGFGYDGVVGLSPIDLARQGLGTMMAAERYAALLFGRGALMSGILQTDRRLPPGAADALQERWQAMTSGLSKSHRVAVLDQGATFVPIQITPEQAQFLETRKFGAIEVARLFGVPPHLLMETSAASNWGTGISEQTRGFINFSLAYRLTRLARRVGKELLPASPRRLFAEHRTEGLLTADTLQRYQGYSLALRDRWMTRGEVRRAENRPVDDPELDEFGPGVNDAVEIDDEGTNDGEPFMSLPR